MSIAIPTKIHEFFLKKITGKQSPREPAAGHRRNPQHRPRPLPQNQSHKSRAAARNKRENPTLYRSPPPPRTAQQRKISACSRECILAAAAAAAPMRAPFLAVAAPRFVFATLYQPQTRTHTRTLKSFDPSLYVSSLHYIAISASRFENSKRAPAAGVRHRSSSSGLWIPPWLTGKAFFYWKIRRAVVTDVLPLPRSRFVPLHATGRDALQNSRSESPMHSLAHTETHTRTHARADTHGRGSLETTATTTKKKEEKKCATNRER